MLRFCHLGENSYSSFSTSTSRSDSKEYPLSQTLRSAWTWVSFLLAAIRHLARLPARLWTHTGTYATLALGERCGTMRPERGRRRGRIWSRTHTLRGRCPRVRFRESALSLREDQMSAKWNWNPECTRSHRHAGRRMSVVGGVLRQPGGNRPVPPKRAPAWRRSFSMMGDSTKRTAQLSRGTRPSPASWQTQANSSCCAAKPGLFVGYATRRAAVSRSRRGYETNLRTDQSQTTDHRIDFSRASVAPCRTTNRSAQR